MRYSEGGLRIGDCGKVSPLMGRRIFYGDSAQAGVKSPFKA